MTLTAQSATRKDISTGMSTLEHRHFATIAAIIRRMPEDQREHTAEWFADSLPATNPRFDRARFLRACGDK